MHVFLTLYIVGNVSVFFHSFSRNITDFNSPIGVQYLNALSYSVISCEGKGDQERVPSVTNGNMQLHKFFRQNSHGSYRFVGKLYDC